MSEKYFQFPLYALAYGSESKQRLNDIIDYCCVEVGTKESAGMALDEKREAAEELSAKPQGYNPTYPTHLALVIGMKMLNVCNGNAQAMLDGHRSVRQFVQTMTTQHGTSPLVRIRSDLFWSTFKGEMSYRRFSVLCAVYSVIGSKDYCRVTRDRIIAGALGYKSAGMISPDLLATRFDGVEPLTENQVRRTLDELENASLFARVQVSKRKVVFSNRLSRKEVMAKVLSATTKQTKKLRSNRSEDEELRAAIKAVNYPNRSPRINHSITTEPPVESPRNPPL